jgi:hypothetical protein
MEQTMQYHSAVGAFGEVSRVEVGHNQIERCVAALTKLFVPEFDSQGVPAFGSLRKAYIYFTGDSEIGGRFRPRNAPADLRSSQDFNSNTFSYALVNAMNVYLSKIYKGFPYREEILISEKKNVPDFRKVQTVQLGYFGELPNVDPETGDYENLAPYADTEAQYDIGQKGGIVWVTRIHILNDNIGLVQGMVKRMARSARLAHAKYVWNFYMSNALCPDGTAWFTLGHGNLGANALDITALVVAITALANMTEPGLSEEKIGLDLASFNWHLVVPIAMWDLAVKKNLSEGAYFAANDLTTKVPNPCRGLFGERNERIITCPFLTAANDWGVIRGKDDVPIVEMSYLNGQEEPELITDWRPEGAGTGPTTTFTDDKLGFKVRHEYGGVLADSRGGYKATPA